MKYLKTYIKDNCFIFVVVLILFLSMPFLYNSIVNMVLYEPWMLFANGYRGSATVLVLGYPCVIRPLMIPCIKQFGNVLTDIKKKILIEDTVVSISKPIRSQTYANHDDMSFKKLNRENLCMPDAYHIWRVRNSKGKEQILRYYDEVFEFNGKTTGRSYKVTYFKYSGMLVKVEKLPTKREKVKETKVQKFIFLYKLVF